MNFEFFVAHRLNSRDKKHKSLSFLIIRITTVAVALSLATMILSVAIVTGFRREIQRKLSDFVGHIIITKHTVNESYELQPIDLDSNVIEKIITTPGVAYVQVFAIKAGLIKHNDNIQGVVFKGVWKDFNWKYFGQYIRQGGIINLDTFPSSKQIIISQEIADKLDYNLGDRAFAFFIQKPPRMRSYKIAGIYNTGLVDFDKIYVLSDIREIQKLNGWNDEGKFLISGYEVFIKNFKDIDKITQELKKKIAFGFFEDRPKLKVQNIKELYPDIFDWLTLVDMNVVVILTIMIIIALINMTTGLLIIILEKTTFIGVLKALGARDKTIRRIFVYNAWFILRKGLIWGNLIGLGLALLQQFFHIIPLNPETYYVSYVPIYLNIWYLLALNVVTVAVTLLFMVFPAVIATKVDPVKAIRFE